MDNKWISATKPPKEDGFYLVTAKYSAKQREVLRVYWDGEWRYWPRVKITAWQPMPAAYMEREGEENEKIGTTDC
jgi:hypothetical protein